MIGTLMRAAALFARLAPEPVQRILYRLGPLTVLIRRSLNRAAPEGLTETVVAAGGLAGARLLLDLQSEKDYWLGSYEPDLQRALENWIRPGIVVYDVGANIGYLTLLMARCTGDAGRVYAFEGLPENVDRLRINLELNGVQDRVQIVSGAVVDRTGPVQFHLGPSGGTGRAEGSAGRDLELHGALNVAGISLDEFVFIEGHPAPQLVKMDIEGGEVLALAGMDRLLREARPILLLELHGPQSVETAWSRLTAAAYSLHRLGRDYPRVDSPSELSWKAYLLARPLKNGSA